MPRVNAYAAAVPWVDFDPRFALVSFYEDATLGYWSSVNGRIGVLAKSVLDLNDRTAAETNRRFDRIETMIEDRFAEVKAELGEVKAELGEVKTGLGEVKTDLGEVTTDLAELKSTVNRIDARVEQQAGWIANDEGKGRRKRS